MQNATPEQTKLVKRLELLLADNPIPLFIDPKEKPCDPYLKLALESKRFDNQEEACQFFHAGDVLQSHLISPNPIKKNKRKHEKHICPHCERTLIFLHY